MIRTPRGIVLSRSRRWERGYTHHLAWRGQSVLLGPESSRLVRHILCDAHPTGPRLLSLMYDHREDGGPAAQRNHLDAMINRINRGLFALGLLIASRGHLGYAFVPLARAREEGCMYVTKSRFYKRRGTDVSNSV